MKVKNIGFIHGTLYSDGYVLPRDVEVEIPDELAQQLLRDFVGAVVAVDEKPIEHALKKPIPKTK